MEIQITKRHIGYDLCHRVQKFILSVHKDISHSIEKIRNDLLKLRWMLDVE